MAWAAELSREERGCLKAGYRGVSPAGGLAWQKPRSRCRRRAPCLGD